MILNYFDIILLIPLLWGLYKGFSKGFILSISSLLALLLGIWGACVFSKQVATWLQVSLELQGDYLQLAAFILTFIMAVVLVHLLAKLMHKLIKAIALNPLNRAVGIIFEVTKNALLISAFLLVVNYLDQKFPFLPEQKKEESMLYTPLSKLLPTIYPYLNFDQLEIPELPNISDLSFPLQDSISTQDSLHQKKQ